jgi:Tfp pilus assembly protein PilV
MLRLFRKADHQTSSEAGVTMIEVLLAGAILIIISLGMVGLILRSVSSNTRSKINSTQTMLAESIVEHVNSTLIGTEDSAISDCAGHSYTIGTLAGGANLKANGSEVDFTENIAADASKDDYHMNYYLNTPCTSSGAQQGIYDVRWNVQLVGGVSNPTNTYLLTVTAMLKDRTTPGLIFPAPVTLRFMSGS